MKILIFSLAYFPKVGGAEVAVKEITDRIPYWHWDMVTKNFGSPPFEKIRNINVYRIKSPKIFFPFVAFLTAVRLHKKNNYDAIWSIMANRAGFAALFFKICYPHIKFLLTLQEGDEIDYPQKKMGIFRLFLMPIFRKIFVKADYVQVISNYLADWAEKMGAKNIEVVPNGVDLERFKIENKETKNKEEKILITVSRLAKKNAVDDIIKSLQYLPKNIKLWVLGSGPEEEKLKLEAMRLKFQDRVNFYGEVSHDDLPKYLAQTDIFIRPSLSEGLGNAFLEAMACGVPIIGTPVGGIPDFLKDGETGLFCEINNPRNISEKIMEYINNPDKTKKITENAYKLVVEKYNWDLISEKMKNIFNKLL